MHGHLRLVAEKINRELRFARDLYLLDENWDPGLAQTESYSYIYYDLAKGELILLDDRGALPLSEQVISGIFFTAEGSMLLYTIQGESGSALFSLDSSVQPMNLGRGGTIGGAAGSTALRFSLP